MKVFPKMVRVIGKTPYKSSELPLSSLRPGIFALFSVIRIPFGKMLKKWSVLIQVHEAPVSYKKVFSVLLTVTLKHYRTLPPLKLAMSVSTKIWFTVAIELSGQFLIFWSVISAIVRGVNRPCEKKQNSHLRLSQDFLLQLNWWSLGKMEYHLHCNMGHCL